MAQDFRTLPRRLSETDLRCHGLFAGVTRHVRDAGQCELGATPLRVQGRQHEDPAFVALQDLPGASRSRISQIGERDVTAHLADADDRAMGRVTLDLALDLFAEGVFGDKAYEGQRIVHREWRGLGSVAEADLHRAGSGSTPALRLLERDRGDAGPPTDRRARPPLSSPRRWPWSPAFSPAPSPARLGGSVDRGPVGED